jgi:hypothetical protein
LVDSEFVECSFVVEIVEVFDYLDFCNHSPWQINFNVYIPINIKHNGNL